jgi:hypothetical protein
MSVPFEFWGWFLGACFGIFGLVEGWAIVRGRRDQTLTYWLRAKLMIEGNAKPTSLPSSLIFTFAMIGFAVWFTPHVVLGWWGGAP